MSTAERDTRYTEQANTLYDDLKAMFEERLSAEENGHDERASEIEQDTRTYLARRLYDVAQGDES